MLIFAEGGKPENPAEKSPRSKGENQLQVVNHRSYEKDIMNQTPIILLPIILLPHET
jgi:hypothetical protein